MENKIILNTTSYSMTKKPSKNIVVSSNKNDSCDKPLGMVNTQVMLRKIKADVVKMLGNYELNVDMTVEEFSRSLKDYLMDKLSKIYDDFDIKLFNLNLDPSKDGKSLTIAPQNFITALWMQGVTDVTLSEVMNSNVYDNSIATYTWDDDTKEMTITPYTRISLFK